MADKIEIQDLHVSVEGKEILKGVNLTIALGKVHALMGPNGSGKSTLANVLMGNPKYEITKGKILMDGEDITEASPDKRAKKGMFLSFQYPSEVAGVTVANFLRTALNAVNDEKISVLDFHMLLKEKMALLNMDKAVSRRYLNEGFSGGEKKKAEILQMLVLGPKYALLDETDSGLDIDALRIVAKGVNTVRGPNLGVFIITHYTRILEYIEPDQVTVMVDCKIVKTGGKDLAEQIEKHGYDIVLDKTDAVLTA